MIYNIIITGDYLLVVDDSEIKEGDRYYLESISTKNMILKASEHITSSNCKKIIAHLPLNDSPILGGVDLLPPLDDVEKLALNQFPRDENWRVNSDNADKRPIWIDGYNKAKEKYRFTEEDMRGFHKFFMEIGTNSIYDALTLYIQSLSQPKMPVGLESEINNPLFSLTIEPKTTINSQGQTQWVGKYIY